jgi:hypothetical protein
MTSEFEEQKQATDRVHEICDKLESLGVPARDLIKIRREANARLAKFDPKYAPLKFGGAVWCSKCAIMTTPTSKCPCYEIEDNRSKALSDVLSGLQSILPIFVAVFFFSCQGSTTGEEESVFDNCTPSQQTVADSLVHSCLLYGGHLDDCNAIASLHACGDTTFDARPDNTDECSYGYVMSTSEIECGEDSSQVMAMINLCAEAYYTCVPKDAFNGEERRFCNVQGACK